MEVVLSVIDLDKARGRCVPIHRATGSIVVVESAAVRRRLLGAWPQTGNGGVGAVEPYRRQILNVPPRIIRSGDLRRKANRTGSPRRVWSAIGGEIQYLRADGDREH